MPQFAYTARDDAGQIVEGDIKAESELDAARTLRADGRFVVRVERSDGRRPAGRSAAPTRERGSGLFREKLAPDDLIFFTSQLAVMVETGVSLPEALDSCLDDGNSPAFQRALQGTIEQVKGGAEFWTALSAHPRVFPPIYTNLVRASEASGTMGPMLGRLADYLEQQRDTIKKIRGALLYPLIMIVLAIGVTIFLMTFVLPKFAAIYAGKEDALPILTRYLMAFSDALVVYGPYLLVAGVGIGTALAFSLRRPENRARLESFKLRLPLIGRLYHKTYLARSLRTLGTMIQSGVSILEGVQLTALACGSLEYRKMWETVNERLETGQQLSEALADQPQIPKAVNKMLGAGERSGRLGSVMERVAGFCESELNTALKTFTSLLEPAIVAFLGIVVGGLVLALLLPIFTISKAMR